MSQLAEVPSTLDGKIGVSHTLRNFPLHMAAIHKLACTTDTLPEITRLMRELFSCHGVLMVVLESSPSSDESLPEGPSLVGFAPETGLESLTELALQNVPRCHPQNCHGACAAASYRLPGANARMFIRSLDAHRRLTVVLSRHLTDAEWDEPYLSLAGGMIDQIARDLAFTLNWRTYQNELGSPFTRLSPTQWRVLCCLRSSLPEKNIAEELGMTMSTAHSHIKAVYRRTNSRSRLCLLQLLESALQQHHLRSMLAATRNAIECNRRPRISVAKFPLVRPVPPGQLPHLVS